MRAVIVVALLAVAVSALTEREYQNQFLEFTRTYNKQYNQNEIFTKYETFKYWVNFVARHNAANKTWEAGINEFSDLMPEEFNKIYLRPLTVPAGTVFADPTSNPVANDVDWVAKGAVTPVKNQGQCGSCWSFSTTGAIEGWTVAVNKKSLPNLAEQQLVDCCKIQGTVMGCSGGWPWAAAGCAQKWGGMCAQGDYPYTARDGTCKTTCKVNPDTAIKGVVQQKGEDQLVQGLNGQPVSICLDASGGFQSYKSGIFQGPCGTQMNHAVLAVGYTDQYYVVKNSWGTSWGNKGFIWMARGKNVCGMSNVLMWAQ
jgi:C1A family cysteine protease